MYSLQSHVSPLGTLSTERWDDMVAATKHWAEQIRHSGRSLDIAERLLNRLDFEHAATGSSRKGSARSQHRAVALFNLRRMILRSWVQFCKNNPHSPAALRRSEVSGLKLLQMYPYCSPQEPPVQEIASVLDTWLERPDGVAGAAKLLLSFTNSAETLASPIYAEHLSPYFDRILSLLLSRTPDDQNIIGSKLLTNQLLERIEALKEDDHWKDLQLTKTTQQQLLATSNLEQVDEIDTTKASNTQDAPRQDSPRLTLSSFELEAMQKRMIDVLNGAQSRDEATVQKVESRIQSIAEPNEELITALVEYYLRINDAQGATLWINRLPAAVLLSTANEQSSLLDRILDCWSTQGHSSAPWRADEILRQVVDSMDSRDGITLSSFNRILNIWHASSGPTAQRKIREWYSYMTETLGLTPDMTTLILVLKAMDVNTTALESIIESLKGEWDSMSTSEKQNIATALLDNLAKMPDIPLSAISLLSRCRTDNLEVSPDKYQSLLQQAFAKMEPSEIGKAIVNTQVETGKLDLLMHLVATQLLLKNGNRDLEQIEVLWRNALKEIQVSPSHLDIDTTSSYVVSVIKMYRYRKFYKEAEDFLTAAEEVLLLSNRAPKGEISLIPLEAYRLLIVRNWYTENQASSVINLFSRLLSLHQRGFKNLKPDHEIYAACMKAKAVASNNPTDLEEILEVIISQYSEAKDDSWMPQADVFNLVLAAYGTDKADGVASPGEKSVDLWKRMLSLGVVPNSKSFNLVAGNVVRDDTNNRSFTVVMELLNEWKSVNMEPDSQNHHTLMSACGQASPSQREEALQVCLRAFGEIRKNGDVSIYTYAILTKSLRRLLKRGAVADKVASRTLQLCYKDGLLGPRVRDAYQAILGGEVWKELYQDRLTNGDEEPSEWSRHIPNRQRDHS